MATLTTVGSVELCTDTDGDPADPAILLIGGHSASMDWWEDGFRAPLAAAGRFVLRYDTRDTGRSVHYPAGAPGYGFAELVADAVGVLDAYGVERACVVGISMGGIVAQLVALDHPDRVSGLALLATTAAGAPDLAPVDPELAAWFASMPAPPADLTDRAAVVEHLLAFDRAVAARSVPYDEARVRAVATRAVGRTADIAATMANHNHLTGQEPWYDRLGSIAVPTVVVHGAEDPLFPGHGAAVAAAIPGARLLTLPAVGHELPPRSWPLVVPAILAVSAPAAR